MLGTKSRSVLCKVMKRRKEKKIITISTKVWSVIWHEKAVILRFNRSISACFGYAKLYPIFKVPVQ